MKVSSAQPPTLWITSCNQLLRDLVCSGKPVVSEGLELLVAIERWRVALIAVGHNAAVSSRGSASGG